MHLSMHLSRVWTFGFLLSLGTHLPQALGETPAEPPIVEGSKSGDSSPLEADLKLLLPVVSDDEGGDSSGGNGTPKLFEYHGLNPILSPLQVKSRTPIGLIYGAVGEQKAFDWRAGSERPSRIGTAFMGELGVRFTQRFKLIPGDLNFEILDVRAGLTATKASVTGNLDGRFTVYGIAWGDPDSGILLGGESSLEAGQKTSDLPTRGAMGIGGSVGIKGKILDPLDLLIKTGRIWSYDVIGRENGAENFTELDSRLYLLGETDASTPLGASDSDRPGFFRIRLRYGREVYDGWLSQKKYAGELGYVSNGISVGFETANIESTDLATNETRDVTKVQLNVGVPIFR